MSISRARWKRALRCTMCFHFSIFALFFTTSNHVNEPSRQTMNSTILLLLILEMSLSAIFCMRFLYIIQAICSFTHKLPLTLYKHVLWLWYFPLFFLASNCKTKTPGSKRRVNVWWYYKINVDIVCPYLYIVRYGELSSQAGIGAKNGYFTAEQSNKFTWKCKKNEIALLHYALSSPPCTILLSNAYQRYVSLFLVFYSQSTRDATFSLRTWTKQCCWIRLIIYLRKCFNEKINNKKSGKFSSRGTDKFALYFFYSKWFCCWRHVIREERIWNTVGM